MTYLAYVIAAFMMLFTNTSTMSGGEGLHIYLRDVVSIQEVFFWASVVIWVLAMAFVLIGRRKRLDLRGCAGCLTFLLVFLPAIQYLMLWLSQVLERSTGTGGITNPVHFWVATGIVVLLGSG
jgi:hypothetical protein